MSGGDSGLLRIVMRQRTELAIALGVSAALIVIAFASGTRARPQGDVDPRASTFNAGRDGARALADVAERKGVAVTRWRARPEQVAPWLDADASGSGASTAIAVLDPATAITPREGAALLALTSRARGADLIVAGPRAVAMFRCLGYLTMSSFVDSLRVVVPGRTAEADAPFVHERFVREDRSERAKRDEEARESGLAEAGAVCPTLSVLTTDTLLANTRGQVVMLQLTVAPYARRIVLISDGALVRNRVLRTGSTRGLVAAAIVPRAGRLVFDEYHQGYRQGGSMAGAVLAWSRGNPLGWMVWQWCALGLLALLAGAVRFGPVRATIPRARRSSLEHVRALATALAASRGHRTAVAAMVRGLQRRLAPGRTTTLPARDEWERYLATLRTHAPNPKVQASAAAIARLADNPESDTAVLSAAHAVEELWNALRP